jgi:signal transduction histidine kinase
MPMLDRYLNAAVMHDLKNRLAILSDELTKLGQLALSPAAHQHARQAHEQAHVLTRKLVEFLTAQQACEAGGLRASAAEEVPSELLQDIEAEARLLLPAHLQLQTRIEASPPCWFLDRHLVRLALDSALYNALRFARGRITLGLRSEAGQLCFYVQDDGPGLQATPAHSSTGLGRMVCEEVAKAHRNHGRVGRSVLRDHADGGAVFELFLP